MAHMATYSCENKEKAKPTTHKKLGVILGVAQN